MKMDTALAEERDQIAPRVRNLMQTIPGSLQDWRGSGGINLQQGRRASAGAGAGGV